VTVSQEINNRSVCLDQSPYTLGAQCFMNLATILDDRNLLKIGMVGTISDSMRERNIMSEGRCLTTMSALCHLTYFLSCK
jgi:hypothetical protein